MSCEELHDGMVQRIKHTYFVLGISLQYSVDAQTIRFFLKYFLQQLEQQSSLQDMYFVMLHAHIINVNCMLLLFFMQIDYIL